jgi:hypothetical protein
MCSAFTDSIRGFGMPMTATELAKLNDDRRQKYTPDSDYVLKYGMDAVELKHPPGMRFLNYGKETTNKGKKSGKEGSWDNAKFKQQTIDILDAFESLEEYNCCQLVMQVDWSSGHSAGSGDGLTCTGVNAGYGGLQPVMRSSTLTAADIGPYPAVYTGADGVEHDLKLQAGDVQHMQFGISGGDGPHQRRSTTVDGGNIPLPPFRQQGAPRRDTKVIDKDGKEVLGKDGKVKIIQGFEGKPKGANQILFETGALPAPNRILLCAVCSVAFNIYSKFYSNLVSATLPHCALAILGWYQEHPDWLHDIAKDKDKKKRPDELVAKRVLAKRPDFANEPSELTKLLRSRGHILVMSPKCHPELAVRILTWAI